MFTALHDGPNEGQIAERIFIDQGRQLLFRTGLNKVQLDKDFRQAISPRAGISLDASGNILPNVSGVRGTVGPTLHLSSPANHTFRNSERKQPGPSSPPTPGVTVLHVIGSDFASVASKHASPPRAGDHRGVPELHNIWVATAETALADSIGSPNDAEQPRTGELQDAGGEGLIA